MEVGSLLVQHHLPGTVQHPASVGNRARAGTDTAAGMHGTGTRGQATGIMLIGFSVWAAFVNPLTSLISILPTCTSPCFPRAPAPSPGQAH